MADIVMKLAGVDKQTAEEALQTHKEIWLAVDALLKKPETQGDKYIPPPPKVESGLTEEQKERCERGRWLQDQVNVVFSVAHSKTRTQPDPVLLADEDEKFPGVQTELQEPPVELPPDVPEQTTQSTLQSALPPKTDS